MQKKPIEALQYRRNITLDTATGIQRWGQAHCVNPDEGAGDNEMQQRRHMQARCTAHVCLNFY